MVKSWFFDFLFYSLSERDKNASTRQTPVSAPTNTTQTSAETPQCSSSSTMTINFYQIAHSLYNRPQDLSLKWWRDESYVCQMLGLSSLEELDQFIMQCKGYTGTHSSRVYHPPPFNAPIDLKSDDNILGMSYKIFGRKGENNNQHFTFGYSSGTPVPFKIQQELLQYVQGTHPVLMQYPEIKSRRISEWRKWATDSGGRRFHQHDLPVIADHFKQYWDIRLPDNTAISNANLDKVKGEIQCLLQVCGLIPVATEPSIIQRTSLRVRGATAIDTGDVAALDRRVRQRSNERPPDNHEVEMLDDSSDDDYDDGSYIDYGVLKKQWFDQKDYSYVGSLEIATKEAYNTDGTLTKANTIINELGGNIILAETTFNSLKALGKSRLGRKLKNFDKLRGAINASLPIALFQVSTDQLLLEWIRDGKRYSNGEKLPRQTHSISKDNGQVQLTDESSYMLYKIYVSYDISLSKFNGLLNSFAVYFLGRPLTFDQFSSLPTLRNWFKRLAIIDRYKQSLDDIDTFGFKSPHGFPVLYFIITDDTKHGKHDTRHAVLRTSVYPDGKPRYSVLTSGMAVTKDARGNALLNVEVLEKLVHSLVLPFLGGGTVDNAGSARAEMDVTFNELMNHLECKGSDLHEFFGVRRQVIVIPDFFHIDNIAINEASILFSGDIERGEFSQFHPRQFLQSMHDIHSRVPDMSQQIIDTILEELQDIDEAESYSLHTVRERPQRWRVNGLFAKRMLDALNILFCRQI